jgi:hypothetical protein
LGRTSRGLVGSEHTPGNTTEESLVPLLIPRQDVPELFKAALNEFVAEEMALEDLGAELVLRVFKAASTRIESRSTGLSKTTGGSNLLLPPPPAGYFPPPLREELRRNESRRVWVTNNGPAIFLTPEGARERLIDDEG